MYVSSPSALRAANSESAVCRVLAIFALGLIVLLAFHIRYLFWVQYGGHEPDYLKWAFTHYFGGIAVAYIRMALSILQSWFGAAQLEGAGSVPPFLFSSESIGYPPGYSLILTAFWTLGAKTLQEMRLAQGLLDSLAVVPLFYLLRWMRAATPIALVGCLLYAVAPWWARGSIFIMAEALLPALVIVILALAAFAAGRQRAGAWFALGIVSSIAPLLRPDMILLCGPLVLWVLLTADRNGRWTNLIVCLAGFAALPVLWGLFNLALRGQFVITTSATSYALWSGLGQIPNPYGYVLSDQLAGENMIRRGIGWHSKEMSAYYWREYLAAWTQHPFHAMATTLKRWEIIALSVDFPSRTLLGEAVKLGPIVLAVALVLLVWERRYSVALLVVAPLGYALLSLGFVYVEPRYVRYASLSYLLANVVVLQAIATGVSRHSVASRWFSPAAIAVAAGAAILIVHHSMVNQLVQTGQASALRQLFDSDRVGPPAGLPNVNWQAAVPGVESRVTAGEGLSLTTSSGTGEYQLMARVSLPPGTKYLALRARAETKQGGISMGVLKEDGSKFLAIHPIVAGPEQDHLLVAPVSEQNVILVLSNFRTDPGRSSIVVKALELTSLCDTSKFDILGKIKAMVLPRAQLQACKSG